jgi:hypothetical protein
MKLKSQYTVQAYNTARDSENKIHDDAVARRYGFSGGLVPGVDVYAYMMHAPVARWGLSWLQRGSATCRFLKPVYDGSQAIVESDESDSKMAIEVHSAEQLCATGAAELPSDIPVIEGFSNPPDPPTARPVADEVSLAVGRLLGMRPLLLTPDYAAQYLSDVRETDPIFARQGLAHPGLVLRTCNWALSHNVMLGPWIHVGSAVQNLGSPRVGDTMSVSARVTRNYEHKGHRFVELDALVTAGSTPVAKIAHIAIYRPRQTAE